MKNIEVNFIFLARLLLSLHPKNINMLLPCLHPELIEAGCDEAGRGCLAGDVYAAAVILPPDYTHPLLNDSKQLTERQRYALREDVERDALAWALGIVTAKEIDEINILNATKNAMRRAAMNAGADNVMTALGIFMPKEENITEEHILAYCLGIIFRNEVQLKYEFNEPFCSFMKAFLEALMLLVSGPESHRRSLPLQYSKLFLGR